MPDLTLEQVRKAGRFAWQSEADGLVTYCPALGDCAWLAEGLCLHGNPLSAGWHHLDECGCSVCHP